MARLNINFEIKKEELIKIALNLFMNNGYEDTTINDIIKSANISKGAMYHYFSCKEDVLDGVINYMIEQDFQRFEAIINNHEMNAIDKLISVFMGSESKPSEVQQVVEYTKRNKLSIFDYRAKELSYKKSVPEFAKIIEQGIAEGTFKTDYPEEIAAFIYSANYALADSASKDIEAQVKAIKAFLYYLEKCLSLDKGSLEILNKTLEKQVNAQTR